MEDRVGCLVSRRVQFEPSLVCSSGCNEIFSQTRLTGDRAVRAFQRHKDLKRLVKKADEVKADN